MMKSIKIVIDEDVYSISFVGTNVVKVLTNDDKKCDLELYMKMSDLHETMKDPNIFPKKIRNRKIKVFGDSSCAYLLPAAFDALESNGKLI